MIHHTSVARRASRPLRRLATLLLVLATAMLLQGQPVTVSTANVRGVDVTFSLSSTQLHVGDPLILTITLANNTLSPVTDISASFQFPEGNGVQIQVQPPGDLPFHYMGGLEPGIYPATPFHLFTGHPISMDMLLLYDQKQPSGFLFSRPGSYELSGSFQFYMQKMPELQKVEMAPVVITVTEPTGPQKDSIALADSPGLVRALQIGVAPTTGSRQSLGRLSESFPQQPLGALASRALGLYDVYGETTASATQARGAEILTGYLKAGVAVYDADYIALSIARGYHLAGNEDLAREWIYYLLRNYPDSIRVRPEDPLITYYFYNPAKFASEVPWYMLKEPWKIPMAPPPTDLRPKEVKQ